MHNEWKVYKCLSLIRQAHSHYTPEINRIHLHLHVTAERAPLPFPGVNRAPERQHGKQRDEAEQRPRQVIDAIRQVVLNPDADDVPVFFHPFTDAWKFSRAKWNCDSIFIAEQRARN